MEAKMGPKLVISLVFPNCIGNFRYVSAIGENTSFPSVERPPVTLLWFRNDIQQTE